LAAKIPAVEWQQGRRRAVQVLFAARLDGRNYRQQHGFLSICRLASGRLPRHPPPFSASSGSMCFCGGTVDHMNIPISRLNQGFKQPPPYAFSRPAMETIIDGCWWPIAGWTILPAATRSQDVDDPTNNPAIVGSMSAGLVRREQWLNHRPLLIIKPEFSCHEPKTPVVAEVNHKEIHFSIG
jgi:hypothetical protein